MPPDGFTRIISDVLAAILAQILSCSKCDRSAEAFEYAVIVTLAQEDGPSNKDLVAMLAGRLE